MSMKIQLLSDLHFEFYRRDGGLGIVESTPVAGDVLVLAGDIMPLLQEEYVKKALGWFCAKWPHVVYVPVNHELYHTNPYVAKPLLESVAKSFPNLHVLNPDGFALDGVRFVGGTMWFPRPTGDDGRISDFWMIKSFEPWVYEEHDRHMKFFEDEVMPGTVLITHHLPDVASVPERFKTDTKSNAFFVANDTQKIFARDPQLWLHGHTHNACDYVVGKTRVVANPRGYPGEHKAGPHNPSLVIEVA